MIDHVKELQTAIRKHRDQRGDNRCWLDDHDLYSVLPEGYMPPKEDTCVELERCKAFIASRHDPSIKYVSPQERIEQLEAEVAELKRQRDARGE